MNARPHMNGNTPETFRKSGRALNAAAMDCTAILAAHASEVFNGRNYQHCDSPMEAREADLAKLQTIRDALRMMESLAVEIFQAGQDRNNGPVAGTQRAAGAIA